MIKRDIFVTRHGFQEPIQVVQGSDMLPVAVRILDFLIPEGSTAVVYNKRPDGEITNLLCSVEGNVITFTPDVSFFGQGYNCAQFRVTNDNRNLFSFTMDTWCYRNIASDDTEEINGNPSLLTQVLTRLGEIGLQTGDNSEEISGLKERVGAAEEQIADHTPRIEKNEENISTLSKKAQTAEDDISGNREEIDVLRSRMNQFAALPEGSTTGDAELADVRIGANGEEYETAGEAVRGQIGSLSEDIDEFYTVEKSKNLFDSSNVENGFLLADGTVSKSSEFINRYVTSEFIKIEQGETYTCSYVSDEGNIATTERISALLYNRSKALIEGSYINETGKGYISLSNDKALYMRVSFVTNRLYSAKVEKGNTYTNYDSYKRERIINSDILIINKMKPSLNEHDCVLVLDDKNSVKKNKTIINRISMLESDVLVVHGKNLCNENNNLSGGLQSDGSLRTDDAWADYKTSYYIPIVKGKTYTFTRYRNGNFEIDRMLWLMYNSNLEIIDSSYMNDTTAYSHTFACQEDGFIRICTRYFNTGVTMMLEISDSPTLYEEWYEKRETNLKINPDNMPYKDILYRKKWIHCGDSFSDYTDKTFDSGIFAGKGKTFPRLISERCGIKIDQTFFASGRTLAYPSDGTFTNSLTCPTSACYYQNIPEDADYITIMLGINDGHHRSNQSVGDGEDNTGVIPLGTIDDETTSTYYGAWNVVLKWLLQNRPFSHIGILVSNGVDTVDYRTAQLEIAKKYGVPYIDLNGDERTPVMIRSQNPNVSSEVKNIIKKKQAVDYDGSITGEADTHPNALAHEFESWFIEDFLRSL